MRETRLAILGMRERVMKEDHSFLGRMAKRGILIIMYFRKNPLIFYCPREFFLVRFSLEK
ncbi:MAG: hypothetical protein IIZ39_07515 [Blautia sp.]|nr:hypothetical protein [Blautia sp.]